MTLRTFANKYPILHSLLWMLVISLLLFSLLFMAMRRYTKHGEEILIPKTKGLALQDAIDALERVNLRYEVVDSNYQPELPPGVVLETLPEGGNRVKPQRIIFITVNAFEPKTIAIPNVVGQSVRHAKAMLESLGFRNIQVRVVPGLYDDLIAGLIAGSSDTLRMGSKVPLQTNLTLLVMSSAHEASTAEDLIEQLLGEQNEDASSEAVTPAKTENNPEEWW